MYRERIHLTVTDMDGWNEAIDAMGEINKVMERIGHPTATIWTDSESVPLAPSESVTLIATVLDFGPSGKLHWNVPPLAVVVGVPTSVPLAPQIG